MNILKRSAGLALLAITLQTSTGVYAADATVDALTVDVAITKNKADNNSAKIESTQAGAKATQDALQAEMANRVAADEALANSITNISLTPGPQGDQGIQGLTGPQGDQGIQGLTGDKGDQGIQGLTGDKGDQGIQGLTGDKGDQGIQGLTGDVGATGLPGLKGETGAQGDQGLPGSTGVAGPQGLAGNDGAPGVNGSDGTNGINGADSTVPGPQGIQGPAGPTGAIGPQGPEGPAGSDGTGRAERFVDNGDGTVTDNQTGLMWEQKTGIVGTPELCTTPTDCPRPHDINNRYAWTDEFDDDLADTAPTGSLFTNFLVALNSFADGALVSDPALPLPTCFAGYCDWRVPNIAELQGMFQTPCDYPQTPCIDPKIGDPQNLGLWSSSTGASSESEAWAIFAERGSVGLAGKFNHATAIAVRGGRPAAVEVTPKVRAPIAFEVTANNSASILGDVVTRKHTAGPFEFCALSRARHASDELGLTDTKLDEVEWDCDVRPDGVGGTWTITARTRGGFYTESFTNCRAICYR